MALERDDVVVVHAAWDEECGSQLQSPAWVEDIEAIHLDLTLVISRSAEKMRQCESDVANLVWFGQNFSGMSFCLSHV